MTDWGTGHYELTAARLEPAAEVAVAALALRGGEHVLDVGCGTGNAALLAARAGAQVAGVDPAGRLVEVACGRVPEGRFAAAGAEQLPFEDGAFDAAISVFGVIFAAAEPAAAELLRVVRPGGRIVFTTWVPEGATARALVVVPRALGAPPPKAVWSDPAVVRGLFAGRAIAVDEHEIAFTADSAEDYVAEQRDHPMFLAAEGPLRAAGVYDDVMREITQVYADANEDPAAFRSTSRYLVWTVTP